MFRPAPGHTASHSRTSGAGSRGAGGARVGSEHLCLQTRALLCLPLPLHLCCSHTWMALFWASPTSRGIPASPHGPATGPLEEASPDPPRGNQRVSARPHSPTCVLPPAPTLCYHCVHWGPQTPSACCPDLRGPVKARSPSGSSDP